MPGLRAACPPNILYINKLARCGFGVFAPFFAPEKYIVHNLLRFLISCRMSVSRPRNHISGHKKSTGDQCFLVPREGLEPSRPCEQQILSLSCLPFHHQGRCFGWGRRWRYCRLSAWLTTSPPSRFRHHATCFPCSRNRVQNYTLFLTWQKKVLPSGQKDVSLHSKPSVKET